MELNRHEIREKALQSLFPLNFQEEIIKKDAIIYALEVDENWVDDEETKFVPEYLDQLVTGVIDHNQEIDQQIERYLRSWQLSRIPKIDLTIMRLALYEILYVPSIPDKVALNEALELAKKYSDDTSRKFINGILSNVMKEMNSEE